MKNLSAALVVAALFFVLNSASLTAQVDAQTSVTNGPVAEYISESAATIGWATSQATNMTVRYGTDRTKLMKTAAANESGVARNHHVRLERLAPGTRYYFQLYEGSEPVGGVGTFSTVEKGETPERSKATIPE